MAVEIGALVTRADELAEAAGSGLAAADSCSGITRVMECLYAELEREVSGVRSPGEFRVACGPGCSACCVVNVSTLVPEAAVIAEYLKSTLSSEALTVIGEKSRWQAEKVRWVEDQERPRMCLPCAFLDEQGRCSIHPVRPFMCRSVSSDDPRACEMISVHGEARVVMDLPQKILCSMVFTSLASVLQVAGMDCRSLELTRMVSNFLDRPVLVDDFLARKRVEFA